MTDVDREAARFAAMTADDHLALAARYLAHCDLVRAQIHASLAAAKAALSQRR